MIKDKLEAYRRKKRNEAMTETIKHAIQNVLPWNENKAAEEPLLEVATDEAEEAQDTRSTSSEDSIDDTQCSVIRKVTYLLYFLLWATMYVIAIEYQFGAVYFVSSALIFVCLNTRTRKKKLGEPSAYSVFNPNCEAIEGTLDASQFEREIMYGIGSMR